MHAIQHFLFLLCVLLYNPTSLRSLPVLLFIICTACGRTGPLFLNHCAAAHSELAAHYSFFLFNFCSADVLGMLPPESLISLVPSTLTPPTSGFTIQLLSALVLSLTGPLPLSHATLIILSPSLPSVPGKLVTKIQAGNFIHLRELLASGNTLRSLNLPLSPHGW